jgi:hypothetical protein
VNPIEMWIEKQIALWAETLTEEVERYLGELDDGIMANAEDAANEIDQYLAVVAEGDSE